MSVRAGEQAGHRLGLPVLIHTLVLMLCLWYELLFAYF
jgi:hypothetical protein